MVEPSLDTTTAIPESESPWRILMVDDDRVLYQVRRKALESVRFRGRPVTLMSACTIDEARALLAADPGIAVALIDLVLGRDQSGLDLVPTIRETLGNRHIRLILNTAFPTMAMERDVVERYEINDYRTKADLDSDRLLAVIIEALRNYDSIRAADLARQEMSAVRTAVVRLFNSKSLEQFYEAVADGFAELPGVGTHLVVCRSADAGGVASVCAARGRFAALAGRPLAALDDPQLADLVDAALIAADGPLSRSGFLSFRIRSRQNETLVVCAECVEGTALSAETLHIFSTQAKSVFDQLLATEETYAVQIAAIRAFAQVSGRNDHDTGSHLSRIERLSTEVARELLARGDYPDAVNEELVGKIGLASLLHDIGMVWVPDDILLNAGELSDEEFEIIARHAKAGFRVLDQAARPVRGRNLLRIAAEIARWHHERWDGQGYPDGLSGDSIPIAARIVAVADAFEAMTSERPFRPAFPVDKALSKIVGKAGVKYDPKVATALEAVIRRLKVTEPEWLATSAGRERHVGGRSLGSVIGRLFWPDSAGAARTSAPPAPERSARPPG